MFDAHIDLLEAGRVRKYRLVRADAPLRYTDAIDRWRHDAAFRMYFISLLTEAPFSVYRWETPPATTGTAERAFEFVLVDSPGLAPVPDPYAFADYFAPADSDDGIVVFENLGRDATLVVPSPRGPETAYNHLAAFTRQAPAFQNQALWQRVGDAMHGRLSDRPVWLSTAGGGVSWLHVRLDDRPKYYRHRPYTIA
jgi:hypothetical protein